jgi:hypothetical protein
MGVGVSVGGKGVAVGFIRKPGIQPINKEIIRKINIKISDLG